METKAAKRRAPRRSRGARRTSCAESAAEKAEAARRRAPRRRPRRRRGAAWRAVAAAGRERRERLRGFDNQRLVVKLGASQKERLARGSRPHRRGHREASSVIYVGRVPFGFFEEQMRAYFKQFGEVAAATVA